MSLSPINKSGINTESVNGSGSSSPVVVPSNLYGIFNTMLFNALEVDGVASLTTSPEQQVAAIRQKVVIGMATQDVISVSQDVQFQNVFEGNVISVAQSVKTLFSGQVVGVQQNVLDKTANTFFNRNGWVVDLNINGYSIPHDRIFRDITVTREENQSNQCMFSLLVADPVEFIDAVWGKPVTVDYITASGSVRIFSGVVAIPEIDIINGWVSFTCSNNRDELINNYMASIVPTVGRYSEDVQGKADTPAEEMNLRMTTIPYSLDFNGYNTYSLNSWYAKASPDVVLTDADVYYRVPKVVWQDRTKIKNFYSLNVSYQYTRLYHYQRPFNWALQFDFCTFLFSQYSLPDVKMIEDAISNAGWVITAPIVFTSEFPPGSCADGASLIFWNTSSFANTGTYSTIFDSDGNVISDPDGRNVYGFRPFTSKTNKSAIHVNGAAWTGSTRFSQYIEEDYSFNVYSSQSIAQFGSVVDANSVDIKDDFDASSWENYTVYTSAPAGAVSIGGGGYYFNQATNPAAMQNAILTEIDQAKTSILSTHRNTQVVVETPLNPGFDLSQTIQITTAKLMAKGKLQRIVHTLAIAEGKGSSTTLTMALFRSKGSATSTPTYVPPRPTDAIVIPSDAITLGSHYGVTNSAYNGHIGNKNNPRVAGTPARTSVDEEFRVDTPAIPDAYRKLRQLPVAANFEVAIPNDPLDITL